MSSRIRKKNDSGVHDEKHSGANKNPHLSSLRACLESIEVDDVILEASVLTLKAYAFEEIPKGKADTLLTGARQLAQRDRDLYFMDRIS